MRLISYMSPGLPASLFAAIASVLDVELELDETQSGPDPAADPFREGTAELGWICSTSYVDLALAAHDPTVRLVGVAWVPDDPDVNDRPVYFGDLVVAGHVAAASLDELEGRRIGINDPVSLSGNHALRFALADRGRELESFATPVVTGGHQRSMDLLAAGELDAAVVDSVARTRRARSDDAVARLRVIDRLGPWPTQPLVASTALSDEDCALIGRRLLAANEHPALRSELDRAAISRIVAVGSDHYAPVRDAMARSRA